MTAGQQTAERVANASQYVGSGGALIFGLTAPDIISLVGMLAGVVIGIAGLLINRHYKRQHLRLVEEAVSKRPDCAACPEREI